MLRLNGLTIYASAPVSSPSNFSSSLDLAVSSTTGIIFVRMLFLSFAHSVLPSIMGIIISLNTMSGISFSMLVNASRPLSYVDILNDDFSSCTRYCWISISSSTMTRHGFDFLGAFCLLLLELNSFSSCSNLYDSLSMSSMSLGCSFFSSSAMTSSSGIRWLLPNGIVTVKVDPGPSSLFFALMVPWWSSTRELVRSRPIPVPKCRSLLVVSLW